eukprot:jgi/Mesen1/6884/ME000353S05912
MVFDKLFRGSVAMAHLKCRCGHPICKIDHLCFYNQNYNGWHLIAKPELHDIVVQSLTLKPHPKVRDRRYNPHKMHCQLCEADLGNESKVGPAEEACLCFKYQAVDLPNREVYSKWSVAKESLLYIDSRDPKTFSLAASQDCEGPNFGPMLSTVRAGIEDIGVMETTIGGRFPRAYQIELYVEAVQNNTIVFLPTGAGKTLVSVMVVKKLKHLNPKKLAVFLADRIPLVHQQAKVFLEAGLRVQSFTGETSQGLQPTPEHLEELLDSCDVISLTAQVFLNKLSAGFPIGACCMIVFDEAHHAQGQHPFCLIMEDFYPLCPIEKRPQILGLTASPAGETTVSRTSGELQKLAAVYGSARVVMPTMRRQDMERFTDRAMSENRVVELSEDEEAFLAELKGYLSQLGSHIASQGEAMRPNWSILCNSDVFLPNFKGELRKLREQAKVVFNLPLEACIVHAMEVSSMYDRCRVVGPAVARWELCSYFRGLKKGHQGDKLVDHKFDYIIRSSWPWDSAPRPPVDGQRNPRIRSSRVNKLVEEVAAIAGKGKQIRVIVFVQKRGIAHSLRKVLEEIPEMAKLNPGELVGHSGFDGMSWQAEQRPMLDRFRSGLVKLLVATSVLEEGLDVPACNAVIRFDCATHITSLVQSRGRARERGSKFITFMDADELKLRERLLLEEYNMQQAVEEMQGGLMLESPRLITALVQRVQSLELGEDAGGSGGERLSAEVASVDVAADGPLGLGNGDQGHFLVMVHHIPGDAKVRDIMNLFAGFAHVVNHTERCGKTNDCALVSLVPVESVEGEEEDAALRCYRDICQYGRLYLKRQHLWLQLVSPSPFPSSPTSSSSVGKTSPSFGIVTTLAPPGGDLGPHTPSSSGEGLGAEGVVVVRRLTVGYLPTAGHFVGVYDAPLYASHAAYTNLRGSLGAAPLGNPYEEGARLLCNAARAAVYIECPMEDFRLEFSTSSIFSVVLHRSQAHTDRHALYILVAIPPNMYKKCLKEEFSNPGQEQTKYERYVRIAEHPSDVHVAVGSFFAYRLELELDHSLVDKALHECFPSDVEVLDGQFLDVSFAHRDQVYLYSGLEELSATGLQAPAGGGPKRTEKEKEKKSALRACLTGGAPSAESLVCSNGVVNGMIEDQLIANDGCEQGAELKPAQGAELKPVQGALREDEEEGNDEDVSDTEEEVVEEENRTLHVEHFDGEILGYSSSSEEDEWVRVNALPAKRAPLANGRNVPSGEGAQNGTGQREDGEGASDPSSTLAEEDVLESRPLAELGIQSEPDFEIVSEPESELDLKSDSQSERGSEPEAGAESAVGLGGAPINFLKDALREQREQSGVPYAVRYLVACILSRYGYCLPGAQLPPGIWKMFQRLGQVKSEWGLLRLPEKVRPFCSVKSLLKKAAWQPIPHWGAQLQPVPEHHSLVQRAVVTPTRVIFMPPEPIQLNFVLRNWRTPRALGPGQKGLQQQPSGPTNGTDQNRFYESGGGSKTRRGNWWGREREGDGRVEEEMLSARPEDFLVVSFRDENQGWIYGPEDELLERVRRVLKDGLEVGGRRFTFLSASKSQLRTHSCWMTSLPARDIQRWLGDFSGISCVAKYLTRLGQLFASSWETVNLRPEALTAAAVAPDVARDGYCFTDGNGKISQECMGRVIGSLGSFVKGESTPPCAVQVRVGGVKGVLLVDKSMSLEPSELLEPRKSCNGLRKRPLESQQQRALEAGQGQRQLKRQQECRSTHAQQELGKRPRLLGAGSAATGMEPTGVEVVVRRSMRKFASPHGQLQVLSWSKNQEVYLNRQAIVLLEALGVRDEIFEALQERHLEQALELFTERSVAWAALQEHGKEASSSWMKNFRNLGVDPFSEPYLRSILEAVYFYQVRNLTEKTRLLVPDGRFLLGVPDDAGVLEEGEIYVHISGPLRPDLMAFESSPGPKTLQGSCVVYRNPCLHPGDVRVLQARDDDVARCAFEGRNDVVFFSTKGARPDPDKMAGGDLDGDRFSVLYMPELVPPVEFQPMDYRAKPAKEALAPITPADFPATYVELMRNVQLGMLANAHLALADEKPEGAMDRDCIELAELSSQAVDSTSTGTAVQLPRRLLPAEYPDFMQKEDRTSRASDKVLGRMFRRVQALAHDPDTLASGAAGAVRPDPDLLVDGWRNFSDGKFAAKRHYREYCAALHAIMSRYGIASEAEVVTGCLAGVGAHVPDKVKAGEEVRRQLEGLQRTLRHQFDVNVRLWLQQEGFPRGREIIGEAEEADRARLQQAAAWHQVAYSDPKRERCLSFPFAVADYLVMVKAAKPRGGGGAAAEHGDGDGDSPPGAASLAERVTRSMLSDFARNKPAMLVSYLERQGLWEQVERLADAATDGSLQLFLFGSSANFLFDPLSSDVDICAVPRAAHSGGSLLSSPSASCSTAPASWPEPLPKAAQVEVLRRLQAALRQDFQPLDLNDEARIPILRFEGTATSPLPFDISASWNGLRETALLLALFRACPALLPLLRLVVKWARVTGVLTRDGVLNAKGIVWLFLHFCAEKGHVRGPVTAAAAAAAAAPAGSEEVEEEIFARLSSGSLLSFWSGMLETVLAPPVGPAKDGPATATGQTIQQGPGSSGHVGLGSSSKDDGEAEDEHGGASGRAVRGVGPAAASHEFPLPEMMTTDKASAAAAGSNGTSELKAAAAAVGKEGAGRRGGGALCLDSGALPGEVLLDFFRTLADASRKRLPGARAGSPLALAGPVDASRNCLELDSGAWLVLKGLCLSAWHSLARTGDVECLLACGTRRVCLRLRRGVASLFRGSEAFQASRLALLVHNRASVHIFARKPTLGGSGGGSQGQPGLSLSARDRAFMRPLYVEIKGESSAVQVLEKIIQGLDVGTVLNPGREGAQFVEGSCLLLFEGSTSPQDQLGFLEYLGQHHLQHRACVLHTASLVAPVGGTLWQDNAYGQFYAAVQRQTQLLHVHRLALGKIRAIIRFGTSYVINLPRAFESESLGCLSIGDLEEAVVRGRRKARSWERVYHDDDADAVGEAEAGNAHPLRQGGSGVTKEVLRQLQASWQGGLPSEQEAWTACGAEAPSWTEAAANWAAAADAAAGSFAENGREGEFEGEDRGSKKDGRFVTLMQKTHDLDGLPLAHIIAAKGKEAKKLNDNQKSASQSLFTHVVVPTEDLEDHLRSHGFSQGPQQVTYGVSVCGTGVGVESRISLDQDLQLIDMTERPVKWLAATLVLQAPHKALAALSATPTEAEARLLPRTARLHITEQRLLGEASKLLRKAKDGGPVLTVQRENGADDVRLAERFHEQVIHVRRNVERAWRGPSGSGAAGNSGATSAMAGSGSAALVSGSATAVGGGVAAAASGSGGVAAAAGVVEVRVSEVTEWTAWSRREKRFKSSWTHTEVEVEHLGAQDTLLDGSMQQLEEFIRSFWHSAMSTLPHLL